MPYKPYPDEFINAVRAGMCQGESAVSEWAQKLSITDRGVRMARKKIQDGVDVKRVVPPDPLDTANKSTKFEPCPDSDEYSDQGWRINRLVEREVKTLADLLDVCGADPCEWTVKSWRCKAWQMATVPRPTGSNKEGWTRTTDEPNMVQLYSVSAQLVPNEEGKGVKAALEAIIERMAEHAPVYAKVARKPSTGQDCLLEIGIPDIHIGKLCWAAETGNNYDSKIAVQIFKDALLDLLGKTSHYSFERILFVVGNDLIHFDSAEGFTTGGTRQDMDTRYHKAVMMAQELITWAIEQLRLRAPVDVSVIPGNHDRISTWAIGQCLEAWFRNTDDVTIDNRPISRRPYEYGCNLILLDHGDGVRPLKKFSNILACEYPEMWGRTKYREAHVGHFHGNKVEEEFGFTVRVLSSLSGTDKWHHSSGYVGNLRRAECFVWHREQGMVGTAVYNLPD